MRVLIVPAELDYGERGIQGVVPNIRFLYVYFPTCNERVQMNTKVSRAARHLFPASAAAGGVVAAAGSGRGKLS